MNIESINKLINENLGVLIYFSGENCGVCEVLKPKIKEAFDSNFPDIVQVYIDAASNVEVAAYFNVFAVPTVLVYLDGKEFARKSRNLSIPAFIDEIKRPYQIMMS